jgi:hypothetical protein
MRNNRPNVADAIPRYPDLASYPNAYRDHMLKLDERKAIAVCSCGRWQAENFPERQLVRTHQFHVFNLPSVQHTERN